MTPVEETGGKRSFARGETEENDVGMHHIVRVGQRAIWKDGGHLLATILAYGGTSGCCDILEAYAGHLAEVGEVWD